MFRDTWLCMLPQSEKPGAPLISRPAFGRESASPAYTQALPFGSARGFALGAPTKAGPLVYATDAAST